MHSTRSALAQMQTVCWLIKTGKKGKYSFMLVTEGGMWGELAAKLMPCFEWIRKLSEHYLPMSNLCSLTLYDILHKLGSSCTSIHLFHIFLPLELKLLSLIYQAWGFWFDLLLNVLYWELISSMIRYYNVVCTIQENITSSSSSSTEMVGHSSTGKAASIRYNKMLQKQS